jgi:hypothetical protein
MFVMAKKTGNPQTNDERVSTAQAAALRYNGAARERVLTHSPRRTDEQRTPLLTFVVSSVGFVDLELIAEDESEAIRAYRNCHGIQGSSLTCRAQVSGADPRPQPQRLAASA